MRKTTAGFRLYNEACIPRHCRHWQLSGRSSSPPEGWPATAALNASPCPVGSNLTLGESDNLHLAKGSRRPPKIHVAKYYILIFCCIHFAPGKAIFKGSKERHSHGRLPSPGATRRPPSGVQRWRRREFSRQWPCSSP